MRQLRRGQLRPDHQDPRGRAVTRRAWRDARDEGQIFPLLLLVVASLLFLAVCFAQLGSANEAKTEAQTAADAAAVAVGQASRDLAVLDAGTALRDDPDIPAGYFDNLPDGDRLRLWDQIACTAAGKMNWDANHANKFGTCGKGYLHLTQLPPPELIKVNVLTPKGSIVKGPVKGAANLRVEATATAELAATCPSFSDLDPGVAALLHRLLNRAMTDLRADPICSTDSTQPPTTTPGSGPLGDSPPTAPELLDLVRANLRVRLTADS